MSAERGKETRLQVDIEYCAACDYGGHCLELAKVIRETTPNAMVQCQRGRQGSFEITVKDKIIYSKLQTMAIPDFEEVAQVLKEVSMGAEPRKIKTEQPIDCVLT